MKVQMMSLCDFELMDYNIYWQELNKIATLNYYEWYDSYYAEYKDVYPSAESLAQSWHNAGHGNDPQILDIIVCINIDNLELLGMCSLEYDELEPNCQNIDTSKIYLTNLLIIPSYRTQGIAKLIIEHTRNWVISERPELDKLYLNCQKKLIEYYSKQGWILNNEIIPDDEEWIEMYYPIN